MPQHDNRKARTMPDALKCEVCGEPVESEEQLCGCELCGRLFGPCCNTVQDSLCLECIDLAPEEDDHA